MEPTESTKLTEKKDYEKMTQEFLVNRDREETRLTLEFAKHILALDLEIKELKEDQKALKDEAKQEGVVVAKVMKALAKLKIAMKTNDADLSELEMFEKALGFDVDIKTQISELVS